MQPVAPPLTGGPGAQHERPLRRWSAPDIIVLLAGGVCIAFGATEMVAWWAHLGSILRWPVDSPPVLFNVALSFAVIGVALVALCRGWRRVALAAGAFDAVLGLLVVAEYALNRSLGLDELFANAYVVQPGTVPGRMPLNTAVCFVLAGAAVAVTASARVRQVHRVLAAASTAVAGVSTLALLGQATATPWAYSWARTTSMALESSVALQVVAVAFLALAIACSPRMMEWLPLLAGAIALVVGAATLLAFNEHAHRTTRLSGGIATRAVVSLTVLITALLAFVVWLAWRAERGRRTAGAQGRLRAEAERAVRSGEQRLFEVLDALPIGVFVASPDYRPYYVNSEAQRLIGGGTVHPAEDLALARALRGERAEFDDVEVRQPDGHAVPVEIRGRPIFDGDHVVEYGLLAVDDISRRKAAERSLAEQAELLDLAYDAIFVTDVDHVIRYWNHGAQLTYGFSKDEALGRQSAQLLHTQYPIPLERIDAELAAVGSWQGELVQTRRDGRRIVVASRWVVRRDDAGRPCGTLEVNRDLTEQNESMTYLRAVMHAAPDLLVIASPDGRVTDCNDLAEQLTGVSRQQIIGSHFSAYVTDTDDAGRAFQRALAEGAISDYPVTIRHRSGSTTDMLCNAAVFTDHAGNPLGVVAAGRDVSASRRADERAARHAVELEAANRELARSNADLEQFAYLASHDLAEPLRAISGPITLLADRYRGRLDEETEEVLAFAIDGCQRMQTIIDGLLALSRVGRLEGLIEPTDAGEVAKEAIAAVGHLLDATHADVSMGPLPIVLVERNQLSQVLQNLISNAVKFVGPGVTPQIHICAAPSGTKWRISVIDNGIGIDPEYRDRVFGMFKRLHTRDEYAGSGIGLALVKKIVERHGGEVGVEDAPTGTGSRIWFTLPGAEGQDT